MQNNLTEQNHELKLETFKKICREQGVKLTHSRLEIFNEIVCSTDHPDVEALYQRVKKRVSTISLDTVYRTLWLIKDLGLVTTIGSVANKTRFEANLDPHHHFTCTTCGMITDFYSDKLNNLKLEKHINKLGQIQKAQVELKGVCNNCSKK